MAAGCGQVSFTALKSFDPIAIGFKLTIAVKIQPDSLNYRSIMNWTMTAPVQQVIRTSQRLPILFSNRAIFLLHLPYFCSPKN